MCSIAKVSKTPTATKKQQQRHHFYMMLQPCLLASNHYCDENVCFTVIAAYFPLQGLSCSSAEDSLVTRYFCLKACFFFFCSYSLNFKRHHPAQRRQVKSVSQVFILHCPPHLPAQAALRAQAEAQLLMQDFW